MKEEVKKLFQWLIPVFICIVIFVIVKVACSIVKSPDQNTIAEQEEKLKSLEEEIDKRNNEWKSIESTDMSNLFADMSIYNGEDDEKKIHDDDYARDFFSTYANWNTGEHYEQLRNELFSMGFTDNHTMVNVFVPKQDIRYVQNDDGTVGEPVYEVDVNGYNLTFEDLSSYRYSTNGVDSYYGAMIQVSTRDLSGASLGSNVSYMNIYVTYTISHDNNGDAVGIRDIEAYMLL